MTKKLTPEQVETIREELAAGKTQASLGKSFNVSPGLISRIARGESWSGRSRRIPIETRFWRKVWKRGSNECWPWLGATNKFGVGIFTNDDRRNEPANRVAWRLDNPFHHLRKDACVGHIADCLDNSCVNPAHLLKTNRKGLMAERKERRELRLRMGAVMKGRVLTSNDVHDILASVLPRKVLAVKYGVSTAHICDILNRKDWAGVTSWRGKWNPQALRSERETWEKQQRVRHQKLWGPQAVNIV